MSEPSQSGGRWILHADMDAFYASIEQRDHPELLGRPVIVGATSARGVVAAASYEARAFGVHSAMPGFRARQLCPEGVFVHSNMERYVEVSGLVHRVFAEFTPDIEPIALDEAFLDVTASIALFGGPLALARRFKARMREALDLAVSVGLGPSKLVAKIACTLSKPDGLLVVPPDAVRWLLDPLPVRRLWGVGPVLGHTLVRLGIETIGQLARFDPERLRAAVGDRAAALQQLASGEDFRPVETERAPKSYGEENTFERDVTHRDIVTGALTAHAEAIARRLRKDGYRARTITIKIKLARAAARLRSDDPREAPNYPIHSRSRTLRAAVDDASKIARVAIDLWDRAGVTEPVRLLGISASSLQETQARQLDLFSEATEPDKLGPTLDAIRERFGRRAISRAVPDATKLTPAMRRKRGET